MFKILIIALLATLNCGCVPNSYEPLQTDQNQLRQYWQTNISQNIVQDSCVECHHQDSTANNSAYVLAQSHQVDYQDTNFSRTLGYLQNSEVSSQLFLNKAQGMDHEPILSENSKNYANLQTFVAMAQLQRQERSHVINYYEEKLSTDLFQNQCSICHVQYGVADNSNLTLISNREINYREINANRVIDYALSSNENFDNLFLKAIGQSHAGGEIIDNDSELAEFLIEFLNLLNPKDQQY